MDWANSEINQQLLCWAVWGGLMPANETCADPGLPGQMFNQLAQFGPIAMYIGIVIGIPIAGFIVMMLMRVVGRAGMRQ